MTTIPTLIKLFAIKMVARSSFGLSRSLCTLSLFISSNSAEVNEKQATSDADINAEKNNKSKMPKRLNKTSKLNK